MFVVMGYGINALAHMIHLFEVLLSVSVGITSMYRVLVLVVLRDLSESWLVCTLYLYLSHLSSFNKYDQLWATCLCKVSPLVSAAGTATSWLSI